MEDRYSKFRINRKQAKQICFSIVADIESYCTEHRDEFEAFLRIEEEKERGEEKSA